jgi:hypothetical protein
MLFAFIVAAAATLVGRVLSNLFPIDVAQHTFSTLDGLNQFFGYWSQILLFVSIVLAMHDRINSIDTGSGKTPLKNDTNIRLIFWTVHGLFVLLTFVFGTASAAMIVSLDRDFESDNIALLSQAALLRKANAADGLYYTFASFIIFTVFDVVALAEYLRSRLTEASVKDKVCCFVIIRFLTSSELRILIGLKFFDILCDALLYPPHNPFHGFPHRLLTRRRQGSLSRQPDRHSHSQCRHHEHRPNHSHFSDHLVRFLEDEVGEPRRELRLELCRLRERTRNWTAGTLCPAGL